MYHKESLEIENGKSIDQKIKLPSNALTWTLQIEAHVCKSSGGRIEIFEKEEWLHK